MFATLLKGLLVLLVLLLTVLSINTFSLLEEQSPLNISAAPERYSPSDWVKNEQIKVYPNNILLQIKDASWATFTNTNSMDPFIDEKANALEIIPNNPDAINVGDIIAYETEIGVIIHRVIEKGTDEIGVYYIVKGDNNPVADSMKVRFEDIRGVVIAVIY